jgi:hypothetical protein
MDRATDERWREALDKKGRGVVRQQLDLRPGPPSELFYDIVDEPPYPSREYCEAWCRDTPAKTGGISGSGVMVIIMSVLVLVCGLRAFAPFSKQDAGWLSPDTTQSRSTTPLPNANWLSPDTTPYHPTAVAPPPSGGGSANSDDSPQNTALQNQSAQNSSIISTQNQNTILPACTAVSSGGNLATVRSQKSCSQLGQPFAKGSGG